MSNYYILDSVTSIEDFVSIADSLHILNDGACRRGEFQFLSHDPISIEVDESSGDVFQDLIYESGVLLITNRMKSFFDKLEIDYLYYKKVFLTKKDLGIEEIYWLALPERIDCLDRKLSAINKRNEAKDIVINENMTGRYEIFRLLGVANTEIIISDRMAELLKNSGFSGFYIDEL